MFDGNYVRTPRFSTTRGGGVIIRARDASGISLDEIAHRAPSVFAEEKHESRSERYVFADTREVLGGLMREGFSIAEVRQGGSRDESKRGFTKHLLRLRGPGTSAVEPISGDVSIPEIVLLNSHDGTSSYQLMAGLFRMICTNGLIAGDMFETIRVGHRKGVREDVIEGAFRVIEDFPRMTDGVREMAGVDLSFDERMVFAQAARELRWETPVAVPGEEAKTPPVEPVALLNAHRSADNRSDLWTTMNRVQENLIRGGQRYRATTSSGRRQNRTVGAVNGIEQDKAINRALWTLAEGMRALKAA